MANTQLYAEIIKLNDSLLDAYKSIQHKMASNVIIQTRVSLLRISSEIGELLQKHGTLSPERSASLAAVSSELDQATADEKAGDNLGVWAAFMRAHGRINSVVADVMTKMG